MSSSSEKKSEYLFCKSYFLWRPHPHFAIWTAPKDPTFRPGPLLKIPFFFRLSCFSKTLFIPCYTIMAGIMVSRWVIVCLSARPFIRPSMFSFSDDNLSKYQWIFTQFGMCIDIMEIWFSIRQVSSVLTVI